MVITVHTNFIFKYLKKRTLTVEGTDTGRFKQQFDLLHSYVIDEFTEYRFPRVEFDQLDALK